MGKVVAIGELIYAIKEIWEVSSDLFVETVPNNFYKALDEMAFLSSKVLGFGSSGEILDKASKIAEVIMSLSNLVIWGILLFYGFKSIFSYFISKKVDMPWKFFIRMIIFGVLANASFFICYTSVFFTESCTEYIRSYIGGDKVSFSFLEEYIETNDLEIDEEESENIYTMDTLISAFIYFSTFFLAVCLGGRYLLIRVFILLSPIFFILGGFRSSEKIFFRWCKIFLYLLFSQIFFCIILGVNNLGSSHDEITSSILVCSILFILCKNVGSFFKLCH